MTLSLYRQIGATKLPLDAGDVGSEFSLDTIDPVKRSMLALLVAAINAELGGAWTRVVTTIPQMRGTTPVVDSYPYEPTAQRMTERSPKFPALFLHRSGEANYQGLSIAETKKTQSWSLHYILGPLTVGGIAKLEAALWLVPDVVRATLEEGSHPAYLSGAPQFDEDTGGLTNIGLASANAGEARFSQNTPSYYACLMQIQTEELVTGQEGLETPYDGMSATYHLGESGDFLHDAFQTNTDYPVQRS
jgi:hypothetical protein